MKLYIDREELNERIRLNFEHLKNDPYYSISQRPTTEVAGLQE